MDQWLEKKGRGDERKFHREYLVGGSVSITKNSKESG